MFALTEKSTCVTNELCCVIMFWSLAARRAADDLVARRRDAQKGLRLRLAAEEALLLVVGVAALPPKMHVVHAAGHEIPALDEAAVEHERRRRDARGEDDARLAPLVDGDELRRRRVAGTMQGNKNRW